MKKVNSFIGKKLLDMLMFSMYPDAKIIYREYVQNAFDSINEAVEEKVLNKVRDGIVTINIDAYNRNISIKDNGKGISVDHALTVLTSIADSQKDGFEQAGVYGIGRLVGAGYCNKLEFRTSAKGENSASIICFDVNKTRDILDNDDDRSSATDVINKIVSWDIIDEDEDKHYFEVILHHVKEEYPILLSEDDIIEYLKEVAPIDYEMPFKNNIMYNSFEADSIFEKFQKSLKYIKLSVNNHLDIRKRYADKIVGTGDEIVGLQYFLLEDSHFGKLAWGWFAITKFSKAIPSSDPNRAIRLRKLNIQVGEANYLNEFFDEARGNNYFYGEIHAIHPNLKPNTSRAGLTPTVEATILFKKLSEYFKQLKFVYNLANKAKTAARDITAATVKLRQEGLTEKEKKEAQAMLNTGLKKMESATRAASAQPASQNVANQKIIEQYTQQIEETKQSTTNNVAASASSSGFANSSIGTSSTGQNVTNQAGDNSSANTSSSSTTSVTQVQDIMHNLVQKYPKEQVWIIRRIFKTLTDNCPKSQLPLIEDLKKLVIKDLEK